MLAQIPCEFPKFIPTDEEIFQMLATEETDSKCNVQFDLLALSSIICAQNPNLDVNLDVNSATSYRVRGACGRNP